jgi:hypothetical protein
MMKTIRVYKIVHHWIDVELEDNQPEFDAFDLAMDQDECNWDSEIQDEGCLTLDGDEDE